MVEMYRLSIEAQDASQDSTVLPVKEKFYTLIGEANRLLQLKQERNEYADGAVAEGGCALACAYIMDNDFVATRHLIGGAHQIALTYNLDLGPAAIAADAKAALATFSRPFFPVQRPYESVPASITDQVKIDSADPLHRLCTGFRDVHISRTLRTYLDEIRLYCFCYQARELGKLKMSPEQARLLNARVQQTELGLLDYPYHSCPHIVDWEALPLEPFERLVQTTALASLTRLDVYVAPNSAAGRLSAKRQRSVIDINVYLWLRQSPPHRPIVEIILWAILFAIQSSEPHEQKPLYLHLQHCSALLGIMSWHQIEEIMYRLLYIPFSLRAEWKTIWQKSQTIVNTSLLAKRQASRSTVVVPIHR